MLIHGSTFVPVLKKSGSNKVIIMLITCSECKLTIHKRFVGCRSMRSCCLSLTRNSASTHFRPLRFLLLESSVVVGDATSAFEGVAAAAPRLPGNGRSLADLALPFPSVAAS